MFKAIKILNLVEKFYLYDSTFISSIATHLSVLMQMFISIVDEMRQHFHSLIKEKRVILPKSVDKNCANILFLEKKKERNIHMFLYDKYVKNNLHIYYFGVK